MILVEKNASFAIAIISISSVDIHYLNLLAAKIFAYKDQSDEELMTLLLQGNRNAFGEIYDRYSGKLLQYFYRMLWQDKEKAEDFMQDIFLKVIRKQEMYDPEKPFKTWLYCIAANMCKNEYKRTEIRRLAVHEIRYGSRTSTDPDAMTAQIELSDFDKALEKAVQELEPYHRDVFILRYRQDLSLKEIGEALDCNEGTVKSRLFYAIKKLAGKLEQFRPEGVKT